MDLLNHIDNDEKAIWQRLKPETQEILINLAMVYSYAHLLYLKTKKKNDVLESIEKSIACLISELKLTAKEKENFEQMFVVIHTEFLYEFYNVFGEEDLLIKTERENLIIGKEK